MMLDPNIPDIKERLANLEKSLKPKVRTRFLPTPGAELAKDCRAIWKKTFLAAISAGLPSDVIDQSTEESGKQPSQVVVAWAILVANATLEMWPAACAERDRIIEEMG